MASGYVYRPDPDDDQQSSGREPEPRREPFGARSRYYRLYQSDPAEARKALYEVYLQVNKSIRRTAQEMGCSRNTVRALIKRVTGEGEVRWNNAESCRPR